MVTFWPLPLKYFLKEITPFLETLSLCSCSTANVNRNSHDGLGHNDEALN